MRSVRSVRSWTEANTSASGDASLPNPTSCSSEQTRWGHFYNFYVVQLLLSLADLNQTQYFRLLRERYDYQGEIRAIGDVLQDQLQHMFRSGFNSFALKEGKDIDAALAGFKTISNPYQAATDLPPLFRRRS